MRSYVGIDPGLTGAIVVLSDSLEILWHEETPTTKEKKGKKEENHLDFTQMSEWIANLRDFNPQLVCLEEVHSMPKQGVASTFKFGRTFGATQAFLQAFDLPYELARPQLWTKYQYGGFNFEKGMEPKLKSREVAVRKFPDLVPEFLSPRARKEDSYHDGKIDALLLADYAKMRSSVREKLK